MSPKLREDILKQIEKLPEVQQRQVLGYASKLAAKKPLSGREFMAFAGSIPVEDLKEMETAIEEGCERIDPSEW